MTLYNKQSNYGIRNLAYPDTCTGTVSLDKSDTTVDASYDQQVPIVLAVGQKFIPTSKCLNSVTIQLQRILDNDLYIELRKSLTTGDKLPDGDPQSSGGRIAYTRILYTTIPTSVVDVTVPLNALLDDNDIANGIWIVLTTYGYDPNCGTAPSCTDPSFIIKGGGSFTTDQYVARKNRTDPWTKFNANLYFKSFKQTYTIPTPVLRTITITPVDSSIAIGGTVQLYGACKDQNDQVITCPSVTWSSSNTAIATISSTGLVTGITVGSTVITATSGAIVSNIATITVSSTPVHKECVNGVCAQVSGYGTNQCSTIGQTCTSPTTSGGGSAIIYFGLVGGALIALYYLTKPKKTKLKQK